MDVADEILNVCVQPIQFACPQSERPPSNTQLAYPEFDSPHPQNQSLTLSC